MMKFAVIVAGGSGQRMGTDIPKQFLLLNGKPVLYYTLITFLESYTDLNIILVLPEAHTAKGEEMIQSMPGKNRIKLVAGGETRFHSVKNGLQHISQPSIVFVHDGVRCMISKELIRKCFDHAVVYKSAIPAVASTDSIRIAEGDHNQMIDRNKVRIVQTPQTFTSGILVEAFQQPYQASFTDEASVVEASGTTVHLIEGDYNNLKITHPIDLLIAENLMKQTIS